MISTTFIAKVKRGEQVADDADTIEWSSIDDQTDLAFDHNEILAELKNGEKTTEPIDRQNKLLMLWYGIN
jgi:hypothetical protein